MKFIVASKLIIWQLKLTKLNKINNNIEKRTLFCVKQYNKQMIYGKSKYFSRNTIKLKQTQNFLIL